MKIEIIEDNIDKIEEPNLISIIELIIDAVRTYPLYELNDTVDYFNELKRLLNTSEITHLNLASFLENRNELNENQKVWVIDSLSSLIEAFELMHLYKISFYEVRCKMESLS